jgi:secondary thiamine-phosphate synthase enzyme
MIRSRTINVPGPGLHEITKRVSAVVRESEVNEGLCTLFIRHTSASLTSQENADPSARRDLHAYPLRQPSRGLPLVPLPLRAAPTAPRTDS